MLPGHPYCSCGSHMSCCCPFGIISAPFPMKFSVPTSILADHWSAPSAAILFHPSRLMGLRNAFHSTTDPVVFSFPVKDGYIRHILFLSSQTYHVSAAVPSPLQHWVSHYVHPYVCTYLPIAVHLLRVDRYLNICRIYVRTSLCFAYTTALFIFLRRGWSAHILCLHCCAVCSSAPLNHCCTMAPLSRLLCCAAKLSQRVKRVLKTFIHIILELTQFPEEVKQGLNSANPACFVCLRVCAACRAALCQIAWRCLPLSLISVSLWHESEVWALYYSAIVCLLITFFIFYSSAITESCFCGCWLSGVLLRHTGVRLQCPA